MNILYAKNIAQILQKSAKWVYSHAEDLGGVKIGGTWIFTERGFEYAIKGGKALERRGLDGRQTHQSEKRVHPQGRRTGMGAGGEKKADQSIREAATRHGFDDLLY
jgi:hypothetical protein